MRLLREPWPLPTMYHIISSGMDTSVSVLPYCAAAVHSPAPNLRVESRGRGLRENQSNAAAIGFHYPCRLFDR